MPRRIETKGLPLPQDEATGDTHYFCLPSILMLLGACPSPISVHVTVHMELKLLYASGENENQTWQINVLPSDWLRGGHVTQSERANEAQV